MNIGPFDTLLSLVHCNLDEILNFLFYICVLFL